MSDLSRIGHVIQNSATTATHKSLKPNRIIVQIWYQTTLKILVSYGIAYLQYYILCLLRLDLVISQ